MYTYNLSQLVFFIRNIFLQYLEMTLIAFSSIIRVYISSDLIQPWTLTRYYRSKISLIGIKCWVWFDPARSLRIPCPLLMSLRTPCPLLMSLRILYWQWKYFCSLIYLFLLNVAFFSPFSFKFWVRHFDALPLLRISLLWMNSFGTDNWNCWCSRLLLCLFWNNLNQTKQKTNWKANFSTMKPV